LISLGVLKLSRGQRPIVLRRRAPGSLLRLPGLLMASFARQPPLLRSGLLGLSTTLLPCGWLYAFAAAAAGTASVTTGAAMMSAFWLGSLPVMLGVGVSFQALSRRFRKHVPRLSAALLIAVGMLTLLTRLNLPAFAAGDASECSCHRKAQGPDAARVEPK
jgi:sulfite exporter TauE/SafE